MFKYDDNTGETPKVCDMVEVVGFSQNTYLNGRTGKVGGFADIYNLTVIVIWDYPVSVYGVIALAAAVPVTCLRKIGEAKLEG